MITPKILNVGVYRHAQKSSQTIPALFLGLYIRGLIRSTSFYPDGSLCRSIDGTKEKAPPALTLTPPGFRSSFEYGSDRENWVIMLAFPAIRFDNETHQMYWNYNGNALQIPRKICLKESEMQELRHTFEQLEKLYHSSLPQNILEAELLVLQILQNFLRKPGKNDDAVEQLRKKLEADIFWEHTITEYCAILNTNRDQLRRNFTERYNIAPGEYRMHLRMNRIRHLIAYSDLTLKEIAYEVGMKNLSHLSRFVKERCGKTPLELSREYRKK